MPTDLLHDRWWDYCALKAAAPRPVRTITIPDDWPEQLPKRVHASAALLRDTLRGARSVLDVGAGDRKYGEILEKLGIEAKYASADVETNHQHDYTDFLAVREKFDAVMMFEIIEHLPVETGVLFLQHARSVLNPDGVLILSTPNAHHPNHVWRIEVTHVRPWPAPDLYAVLRLVGFEKVELYKQIVRPRGVRRVLWPITAAAYRLLEFDYAQTTLAVARP